MRVSTLLATAVSGLALLAAGSANAVTYLLQYSDAFGTGSFGTVNVTGGPTDLHFVVSLISDKIIDTGSHYAFSMNLGGSGFALVGPATTDFTLSTGTSSNSPFTGFDLALNCIACGPGASKPWGSSLTFDITGANLSVKAANPYNGHTIYFATDVVGAQGLTGAIGGGAVVVPEPASWGLMILGFGGIGAAMRTRRRALAVR
jgi:hypothetical protein